MKIKIISAALHGACSYYRSMGVFPKIKNVEVDIVDQFDWHILNYIDVIFIERPCNANYLLACKTTKNYGLKLWIDYDDYLFWLPSWNPFKNIFENEAIKKVMIDCLKLADVVTVPTEKLREELCKYNMNTIVVPQAFNDYNFKFEYNPSENQSILWRGSITHRGDILAYIQELVTVAKANKEWKWEFIGKDIWYITDYIDNKNITPELNIVEYFTKIKEINPSIYIVPLYPNIFNDCKSNCGWLEATYAGAVTLAPDSEEWRRPGIINYKNKGEFGDKLHMLINDPEKRKVNYKASFEYIKKNFVLSHVNKQREKILNSL
jgi:hypothetical protein